MEAIGGGLVFVSMAIFIASLIAIFKPIKSLWMPTRGRAAIVLLGSLFLMGVAASMLPNSPATQADASPVQSSASEKQGSSAEKGRQPVAETAAQPVAADINGDFTRFYRTFEPTFDRCNNAFAPIGAEAGSRSPSPVRLYQVAQSARDTCRSVSVDIGRLSPPRSLTREMQDDLKRVIDVCQNAVTAQAIGAGAVMTAVDEGFRPSKVAEMTAAGERATQQKLGCVAGWMIQMRKLGLDEELVG